MIKGNLLKGFVGLFLLLGINYFASLFDVQWDLTADKRNTISDEAKELARAIKDPTIFTVLLDGNVPSEFKAYRDYIDYYLSELARTNNNIRVDYRNPNQGEDANQFREFLRSQGVDGVSRQVGSQDEVSKSLLYPYVSIIDSTGLQFVELLEGKRPSETETEALSRSQLKFESKLLRTLRSLKKANKKEIHVIGPQATLVAEGYNRDSRLNRRQYVASDGVLLLASLDQVDAVICITDQDIPRASLVAIDICAQRGIPILWFIDKFRVSLDSLGEEGRFLATASDLNIEDYLFKLGVKIDPALISDLSASAIPQVTGAAGGTAKTVLLPYPYHILLQSSDTRPVSARTGQPIHLKYTSPITVSNSDPALIYTALLSSSKYSQVTPSPVPLDFSMMQVAPVAEDYNISDILVGLAIEGPMPSYYKNRLIGQERDEMIYYLTEDNLSQSNTQILISDASIALPTAGRDGKFYPVGYNTWDRQMYGGNIELINNLLESVIEGDELMSLADRDVSVGILDVPKWKDSSTLLTAYLLGLPTVLVLGFYFVYNYIRRRKYANYKI